MHQKGFNGDRRWTEREYSWFCGPSSSLRDIWGFDSCSFLFATLIIVVYWINRTWVGIMNRCFICTCTLSNWLLSNWHWWDAAALKSKAVFICLRGYLARWHKAEGAQSWWLLSWGYLHSVLSLVCTHVPCSPCLGVKRPVLCHCFACQVIACPLYFNKAK